MKAKTGTTLDKLFKDIEKVLPIRIECMELLYSQNYPYIPKDDSNGKS